VLVAAVLRPEEREHCQLEVVRLAREQRDDTVELPVGEAEGAVQRLFRDRAQKIIVASASVGKIARAARRCTSRVPASHDDPTRRFTGR
jgi:hypothetical protein